MYSDDRVVVGKAQTSGGVKYQYLPIDFNGAAGPTANRRTADPLSRMAAADMQSDLLRQVLMEIVRTGKKGYNQKRTRELIDDYMVSLAMERGSR